MFINDVLNNIDSDPLYEDGDDQKFERAAECMWTCPVHLPPEKLCRRVDQGIAAWASRDL